MRTVKKATEKMCLILTTVFAVCLHSVAAATTMQMDHSSDLFNKVGTCRGHAIVVHFRGGAEEEEDGFGSKDGEQYDYDALDAMADLADEEKRRRTAGVEESTMDEGGAVDILLSVTRRAVIRVGKATVEIGYAVQRALDAGMEAYHERGDDQNKTVAQTIVHVLSRMIAAAFYPSRHHSGEEVAMMPRAEKQRDSVFQTRTPEEQETQPTPTTFDSFLSTAYSVPKNSTVMVHGGSLDDAMRMTRSQARLLVVFLPANRPVRETHETKQTFDRMAIASLLSPNVSKILDKRARKKEIGRKGGGSFVVWSAKHGSAESAAARKRLKVTKQKKDSPVLLVAYVAQTVDGYGRPKLIPRILAQHHCNPPPSPQLMSAWLNTLRKRHVKQYESMETELLELEMYNERTAGYKSSMKEDQTREREERNKEDERLAMEAAELARAETLKQRRDTLRSLIPEEPDMTLPSTMVIAVRFADGRRGRRNFSCDTRMDMVFNWIDVTYGAERETIRLMTMTGHKTFDYTGTEEALTLKRAGLGKMTSLRIVEKRATIDDADGSDDR